MLEKLWILFKYFANFAIMGVKPGMATIAIWPCWYIELP